MAVVASRRSIMIGGRDVGFRISDPSSNNGYRIGRKQPRSVIRDRRGNDRHADETAVPASLRNVWQSACLQTNCPARMAPGKALQDGLFLFDRKDVEVVDVSHHAVFPAACDKFGRLLFQQASNLPGKVCFAA